MSIPSIHGVPAVFDVSPVESAHAPASLDDMVQQAFQHMNNSANTHMAAINHVIAGDPSDPSHLAKLQAAMSDYNIEITMAGELSRKAISAVETLVKAQ